MHRHEPSANVGNQDAVGSIRFTLSEASVNSPLIASSASQRRRLVFAFPHRRESVRVIRTGHTSPVEIQLAMHAGLVIWNQRQGRIVVDTVAKLGWVSHVVQINGDLRAALTRQPRTLDLVIFVANHVTEELLHYLEVLGADPALRILTIARDRDAQTVADALRAGSDDYLRSPFATEELAARLTALVTFNVGGASPVSPDTRMIFDFSSRTIESGNQCVSFSPAEWAVLVVLLEQEQRPITAEDLAASIESPHLGAASIPSIVSRVRRRMRAAQFDLLSIETVHRRGYSVRFQRPVDSYMLSERARTIVE